MKIKIAIVDPDKNCLSRFASRFNVKYASQAELYFFSDLDKAVAELKTSRIDVLLVSDQYTVDVAVLPRRCAFAYFVDQKNVDMINDQPAICKFQKGDQIFKKIQGLYAEISGPMIAGGADNGVQILAFSSACGGVGSSTMAAACAMHFAQQQKKVLYLNLETIGVPGLFFEGVGQPNFRDVITALRSPLVNLKMKIESCTRTDPSGVEFFVQSDVALDMLELESDDVIKLLDQLRNSGGYDYIILDMDFSLEERTLKILRKAQNVILISDGTMVSNKKTVRAYEALVCAEGNAEDPLVGKLRLMYNKVSSQNGQSVGISDLRVIGGAPRYTGADSRQVVCQLAQMDYFDTI